MTELEERMAAAYDRNYNMIREHARLEERAPTVLSDQLNTWWGLSKATQDSVKDIVPFQTSWTLDIVKQPMGIWTFSLPEYLTYNEALCNGTEDVIDWHYKNLVGESAKPGDELKIVISSERPTDQHSDGFYTICMHLHEDEAFPGSNVYYNLDADEEVWLCPYLQVLFKEVPENLWIEFKLTPEQLLKVQ